MRSADDVLFALRDETLVLVDRRQIAAVTRDGKTRWERAVAAPGDLEAIVATEQGDIVIVGQSPRPEDAEAGAPLPGCFVTKRAGGGGAGLWAVQASGTGAQFCRAVAVDSSGDVYVAGFFDGAFELGGTRLEASTIDLVVMRLGGGDGSIRWIRRIGGPGVEIARAIAVDRDHTVVVGGHFADGELVIAGTVVRSAGDHDGVLIALASSTGESSWATRFGDVGFDLVKSLAIDPGSHIYASGAWMRPQDFGGEPPFRAGTMDAVVVKYARDGGVLWRRLYPGSEGSQAHAIALDANGAVIVGHFKGELRLGDRELVAPHDRSAAYTASLSTAGDVRTARLVGEAAQYGSRLAVSAHSVVIGGRGHGDGHFCGESRGPAVRGADDHFVEWTAPVTVPRASGARSPSR